MVPALDHARLLDDSLILGFLHDADDRRVPAGVAADAAQVSLCHPEALPAEANPLLGRDDGLGEAVGVLGGSLDHVEGEPLGRLGTYTRKAGQLVDEILDGPFEH